MAIALRNGKVSLKNGKVSCTCCEPDCCMYPADQFGILFGVADLPDEIILNGTIIGNVLLSVDRASPIADGSVFFGPAIDDETILVQWSAAVGWSFGESSIANRNCLIGGDGNLTPGDDRVEDQFDDTYSVAIAGGFSLVCETIDGISVSAVIPNQSGRIITREGLCKWRGTAEANDAVDIETGEELGTVLLSLSLIFDGVFPEMEMGFAEILEPKYDDKNTPAGDYGIFTLT